MLEQYLTIQQIIFGVVLGVGIQLLIYPLPKKLNNSYIYYSSKLLGLALCALPLASFIYYFSGMVNWGPNYATALNLTVYSLVATLLSNSVAVIIKREHNQRNMLLNLLISVAYTAPLWIALCIDHEELTKHTLIATYTFYCLLSIALFGYCCILYSKERKKSDKQDALRTLEMRTVNRMLLASLCLLGVGLFSPSFFSYPLWLGALFIVVFIAAAGYVYAGFATILSNNITDAIITTDTSLEQLDDETLGEFFTVSDPQTETSLINKNTLQHIEQHLTEWIGQRKYLESNITIQTVAKALYTNRTYLSRYINQVYRCSFRGWLAKLRLEEAKALLTENPSLTLNDVADKVGSASVESFVHLFTRFEGVSPTKWRESHLC